MMDDFLCLGIGFPVKEGMTCRTNLNLLHALTYLDQFPAKAADHGEPDQTIIGALT